MHEVVGLRMLIAGPSRHTIASLVDARLRLNRDVAALAHGKRDVRADMAVVARVQIRMRQET